MALVLADRVQETTTTTGTGTLTLAGAVVGFQSFIAIGNANTTYYTILSGIDWEVGIGTYTLIGTTLSRDTVLSSSAAGAKIAVVTGAAVFCGYPASKAVILDTFAAPPAIGNITPSSGTFTSVIHSAGTASVAPIILTAGTNLTAAAAGAVEYDTTNTIAYFTGNTTNGRGIIPNVNYFRLAANGAATATTISPFFGTTSSVPLVANGVYEIEIECYFLKTTAGTLVWTLTNSAVVTNMTVNMQMTAVTGIATIVSPLTSALVTQTAAAVVFPATASLTTAVNHFAKFKIILENASSTSVRLNVTNSAGTVTPLRGSFWKATRITNAGTYAA